MERIRKKEEKNEMFWRLIWQAVIVMVFVGAILLSAGCGGGSGGGGEKTADNSDMNQNNNPDNQIVDLKITPPKVTLTVGAKQVFSANEDVYWEVEESNGGVITESGAYTAPQLSGTYHVSAVLKKNKNVVESAEVIVVSYKGSFKVIGSTLNDYGPYNGGRGSTTVLASGKILIMSNAPVGMLKAEIYDPVSNTSQSFSGYIHSFDYHTATLLSNNKVLIIGVWSVVDGNYSSKIAGRVVEIFDPDTGKFTLISKENKDYGFTYGHTATLLADETLLVAGLKGVEIYNPNDDSWKSLTWQLSRSYHAATLLSDGRVLIVGGMGASGSIKLAEIYDPSTQKISPAGNMIWSRLYHSATLLSDGRVLITGGSSFANSTEEVLKSAEIFDPNLNGGSGGFFWVGDMSVPRRMHAATKLVGDIVLIAGGYSGKDILSSAEIFNPTADTTNAFALTGQMINPRYGHIMIQRKENNNVLAISGNNKTYQFAIEEYY